MARSRVLGKDSRTLKGLSGVSLSSLVLVGVLATSPAVLVEADLALGFRPFVAFVFLFFAGLEELSFVEEEEDADSNCAIERALRRRPCPTLLVLTAAVSVVFVVEDLAIV